MRVDLLPYYGAEVGRHRLMCYSILYFDHRISDHRIRQHQSRMSAAVLRHRMALSRLNIPNTMVTRDVERTQI